LTALLEENFTLLMSYDLNFIPYIYYCHRLKEKCFCSCWGLQSTNSPWSV